MSLYTYRWRIAQNSLESPSISGVTAGDNARDALARAMTTMLADGQLVGDALSASPKLLQLVSDSHAPEVAFKHGDVLISMVSIEPANEHSSVVLRDARRAAVRRRTA